MSLDHTSSDYELCVFALGMWANYIETGKPTMSLQDMIDSHQKVDRSYTRDQMRLVLRLRDLQDKLNKPKNNA